MSLKERHETLDRANNSLCYWFWHPCCTDSRESTCSSLYRDWHVDSITCDKLFLTYRYCVLLVSEPTVLAQLAHDLINFDNKPHTKTLNWQVLVTQTKLKITMSRLKIKKLMGIFLGITNKYKLQKYQHE